MHRATMQKNKAKGGKQGAEPASKPVLRPPNQPTPSSKKLTAQQKFFVGNLAPPLKVGKQPSKDAPKEGDDADVPKRTESKSSVGDAPNPPKSTTNKGKTKYKTMGMF